MYSAPPVLVPVGRFVWAGRIACMLSLITLALGVTWALLVPLSASLRFGGLLAWLALCVLSAWCCRHEILPPGTLSWDGQSWWFHMANSTVEPRTVSVRVVWDVQSALLVHVGERGGAERQGSPGFAWLRARDMAGRWHVLRCALHVAHTL